MNGSVCIDASVAAKWVLPESDSNLAIRLQRDMRIAGTEIVGPPQFQAEVTSAIYKTVTSGQLTIDQALGALRDFATFPATIESPPGLARLAVQLSFRFGWRLPYDGFYLALGELLDCDVWTADRNFHRDASPQFPRLRLLATYGTP